MEEIIKKLESSLHAAFSKFHEELQTVRSNRPSVGLIEDIKVECYGQIMPIKQVASLSIRPPREIEVNAWDKSVMPAIMKAIDTSNIVLSVSNDGNLIRVSLPSLTDERRNEFMKLVKKMAEATRIQIRNLRDEAMKALRADESISEDQEFKAKERIQKFVDETNSKIESSLSAKLAELGE